MANTDTHTHTQYVTTRLAANEQDTVGEVKPVFTQKSFGVALVSRMWSAAGRVLVLSISGWYRALKVEPSVVRTNQP